MKLSLRLGTLAAAAALLPAAAAHAGPPAPDVPGDIAVGGGEKVFLVGHAVGVQIYSCNGASWGLVAPRADLYADNGKVIMTHFAGPTWQVKNEGSKVVARRVNGVMPDQTAIPWLLLEATSTTHGHLAHTTHIQRINTTGGLPPAAGTCTPAIAGAVEEIPYTADYYFWK